MSFWGLVEEQERRARILVAAAAYAYEIEADPILTDKDFDTLAASIRPHVTTGHPVLDEFFIAEFEPFTGAWVRRHPDQPGLKRTCAKIRRHRSRT